MAFYLSRVGAPACVAGLEEMIAMGAKKMIIFGCCGVLDEVEVQDKIIIPSSTIRDEGTSYHYLPAGEEIGLEDSCAGILEDCLVRRECLMLRERSGRRMEFTGRLMDA